MAFWQYQQSQPDFAQFRSDRSSAGSAGVPQAETSVSGATPVQARTGMYTTGLIVQAGEQRICLYDAGRQHAGENLAALLRQRKPRRAKPLVMSDALASNAAEEQTLIRCHCLAHGRRKFSELEDVFPRESAVVMEALDLVFEHEEEARVGCGDTRPLNLPSAHRTFFSPPWLYLGRIWRKS